MGSSRKPWIAKLTVVKPLQDFKQGYNGIQQAIQSLQRLAQ